MKTIDTIASHLLDIEPPNSPPEGVDYSSILMISISALLLLALLIMFLRSENYKNKRALLKLRENLISSLVTPKEAAYKLAEIIKSAHKTKKLTASDKYPQGWNIFINRLSTNRYEAGERDKQEIIKLIDDANSWLKIPQS